MRVTVALCLIAFATASCSDDDVAGFTTSTSMPASITLAPDGAYPVITPSEAKSADLKPGTYRIRAADQSGWPEQCLDEVIVFPRPQNGDPAPVVSGPGTLAPDWEQKAIDKLDAVRELRSALCDDYERGTAP